MKPLIYCKTTAKATQSFYLLADGKEYFLFNQKYRVSNKEHFRRGINLDSLGDFSNVRSNSVRRVLDKLPNYIRYVEKEYEIKVLDKTLKQASNKKPYKRTPFLWNKTSWGIV